MADESDLSGGGSQAAFAALPGSKAQASHNPATIGAASKHGGVGDTTHVAVSQLAWKHLLDEAWNEEQPIREIVRRATTHWHDAKGDIWSVVDEVLSQWHGPYER
jgi:hypothetical protein